jgi:hypothetical protein
VAENVYKSEDKLLIGEENEGDKPVLEAKSEDYKDNKLMMWFECEDAVPALYSTDETLLTWHESEVGPLLFIS